MELASKLRWILVIAVMVIALILVSWGLFSIAQNIFTVDETQTEQQETEVSVESVSTASYTVDGPVVANNLHRSFRIEVSENVVTMRVYGGYGSFLISENSYPNTAESYAVFMSALENENISSRAKGTTPDDDFSEVGVCATGRKFIVELDKELRRWSTSCNNREGTAGFNMQAVGTLFQLQVPDYNTIVSGTGL
jgi:hypothetical protein